MKIHLAVFILFHVYGEMAGVILVGALEGSKLVKKNGLILIVFARLPLQTFFCVL
jgi:hypothetical protein